MPASFNQRVGVFIDVQNMFYATKNLYSSKLNYGKLLDYIARGRDLVRSVAYVVQTPEIDQSNFLTMLRSNGYEVRSKELKQRPDGSCKGDWDMGLALDAISMAERLDVVAIVSGDGDFVELVAHLKARGVRVEVYSFPYSTAEELRSTATEFYQMGPEIVMNPNRAFANPEGRSDLGREPRHYRDDEYSADGYNRSGYNREGYNRGGYNRSGYNREGFRDEYRAANPDEYRPNGHDGSHDFHDAYDSHDENDEPAGTANGQSHASEVSAHDSE
jgi:uncharacterized LabA/DUF88 family protein